MDQVRKTRPVAIKKSSYATRAREYVRRYQKRPASGVYTIPYALSGVGLIKFKEDALKRVSNGTLEGNGTKYDALSPWKIPSSRGGTRVQAIGGCVNAVFDRPGSSTGTGASQAHVLSCSRCSLNRLHRTNVGESSRALWEPASSGALGDGATKI